MRYIHRKGHYDPSMLSDPDVTPLITETANALNSAVHAGLSKSDMPEAMRAMLKQNVFVFSGFKTHAQLSEVSKLLYIDGSDRVKPFDLFAREVRSINDTYNLHYLRAEYNFAVSSSRAAAQWHRFQQSGDRFFLQYRTAGDERVREDHKHLNRITLPIDDPFWHEFMPPNGWNCRCTVVQVLKNKYPQSDSHDAIEAGRKATTYLNKKGKNAAAIFRFNPGIEHKIFPPHHPYLPKGCGDCQFRDERRLGYKPDNPLCKACTFLAKCFKDATIEDHRKAFDELVSSGKYTDLEFNPRTGAYKAIHKNHISHDKPNDAKFFGNSLSSTDLEKECLNILFKNGDKVILREEKKKGSEKLPLPALDLFRNGEVLDIRAVTENNEWTICNGINAKRKQIGRCIRAGVEYSDKVCLYFHDTSYFSQSKMEDNIQKYKKSNSKLVKKVVCVLFSGQVYEYDL